MGKKFSNLSCSKEASFTTLLHLVFWFFFQWYSKYWNISFIFMFSINQVIFFFSTKKRLKKPSTVNTKNFVCVNKLRIFSFDYLPIVILQKTSNQQILKTEKEEVSKVQLIKQVNGKKWKLWKSSQKKWKIFNIFLIC